MAKKILIVDDSRTIRQQLRFTLEKSGYTVVEAEDGLDGIAQLKSNLDTAAIISDVNMPNKGGLEMVEDIKKDPALAHVPVMMLTTEGAADLISKAKSLGCKGWIVKPFKPDQLVIAMSKLVGGP